MARRPPSPPDLHFRFQVDDATVTRGTTDWLVIETEPPGATVRLSNGVTCVSPCRLKLRRKEDYALDIRLDGFEPARAKVIADDSTGGSAGRAGNVLIGGLIGLGIDAATGADKTLTPNPVRIRMVPIPPASPR